MDLTLAGPDIDVPGATVGDPQSSAAAARVGVGGAGVGGAGVGGAGVDMGTLPPPARDVPGPREAAIDATVVPDESSLQHP